MDTRENGAKSTGITGREDCALAPFFASPGVGVALYDEGLRYRVVNGALAAMNGLGVEAHLGKMPHEVLGPLGAEFEQCLSQGFAQNEPVVIEFGGYLPTRQKKGHWINTFIPIKTGPNEKTNLFVLVLEVSEKKRLEDALFGLAGKLLYVKDNLQVSLTAALLRNGGTEPDTRLLKSLELVEESAADIGEVLRLIRPSGWRREFQDPQLFRDSLAGSLGTLPKTPEPGELTQREQEVLCLLASSQSNKQIASRLGISVRTVESHRRRVMEKLGLHSLSELVHYAIRKGLVVA